MIAVLSHTLQFKFTNLTNSTFLNEFEELTQQKELSMEEEMKNPHSCITTPGQLS